MCIEREKKERGYMIMYPFKSQNIAWNLFIIRPNLLKRLLSGDQ